MRRKLKRACFAQLRQTFGVNDFRPGQKAVVSALLSGRDVLCILPTGAGKSLCWQLPAVMHPGLTVVISPLIALMDDQVRSLRRHGIAAVTINSLMPPRERQEAEESVRSGAVRIMFVSPERMETLAFQQLCRDCPPWLLVVDEAHCVVQWGEAFRPSYSRIGGFAEALPARPVICAMTATADEEMQSEIARSLQMRRYRRMMLPVMRENLIYSVCTTTDRNGEIRRILRQGNGRTVIFCRSRARTEQLAAMLQQAGRNADFYHAGRSREERTCVQERFCNGQLECLAATTAFGMGVDIPDIRCVIHDSLPGCVTDLVQQSGRAGRDGQAAQCVILFGPEELLRSRRVLYAMHRASRWKPAERVRLMREHWRPLRALLALCMTQPCIPAGISAAFGQRMKPCGRCSACRNGALVKRVPPLPHMSAETLRLWLLRWQRNAMALRQGRLPETLISEEALKRSARSLMVPQMADEHMYRAMERLMTVLVREAKRDEQGG